VVSAHNLETRIWERLAATASRAPERWVFRSQAARMDRFERGVFARADAVTAVSGGDAAAIRARGATLVEVVANGVDLRYFTPRPGEEEPDTLAFTGSMDWRPNQEGVRWFAERVHPRLREKRAYTLLAVGRRPPGWMTRPGGLPPNIRVTGTVEDVRPYIARGEVYVAPLLAGGGSRLKILEALAMGRAVVSTTVGAEGLDVVADRDLVLADDPGAFADAVVALLDDAPRRRALGKAGRKLVESRYDWDVIAEVQARLWTRLIEGEAAPIGTTT
jgi:glycosyltransferase involved in cell wall biosynthesis